jgi:acyl carrier protein
MAEPEAPPLQPETLIYCNGSGRNGRILERRPVVRTAGALLENITRRKTMTRDDVIAVIKKNILENLEDLEESQIDPAKSMKDFGANSLDIIEVVSNSMRELNIKIPRAELANVNTIGELADKFMEHVG